MGTILKAAIAVALILFVVGSILKRPRPEFDPMDAACLFGMAYSLYRIVS
jgi:hypothetical protein